MRSRTRLYLIIKKTHDEEILHEMDSETSESASGSVKYNDPLENSPALYTTGTLHVAHYMTMFFPRRDYSVLCIPDERNTLRCTGLITSKKNFVLRHAACYMLGWGKQTG